jgi:acyl dehydratase
MPINPGATGATSKPLERSWTSKDSLLYALGVGAGTGELAFTTENTAGVVQQVLPTQAVVLMPLGFDLLDQVGEFDWTKLLHAGQGISLAGPLPPEGRLRAVTRITGVYDKKVAALVVLETEAVDADSEAPLFTTTMSLFLGGEGGFGGEGGPRARKVTPPDRAPDFEVSYPTSPDQALLYRLNGDRNPLHSDPAFAAKGGFDRPILHGLCTYGFTGRALLHSLCGGDPVRFGAMDGRFTAPVFPGDDLTVRIWADGDGADFQTFRSGGSQLVLDGRFTGA